MGCGRAVGLVGIGLLGIGLLAGCPGALNNDNGNGDAGPAEMRVARFDVAAGEVQMVSSNLRIIAAEGMTIEGDLMVDPSEGGDLELIAETGDIIVRGRIVVMGPDETNGGGAMAARRGKSGRNGQNVITRRGASIIVRALGPGALIAVGPTTGTLLRAGDGMSGANLTIQDVQGSIDVAEDGERGGNIELYTPNGTIRFFPGSEAKVQPGNGGDGGNIIGIGDFPDLSAASIWLTAGNGGDSGRLIIDAPTVEDPPTLQDLDPLDPNSGANSLFPADLISGGRGGEVSWDNRTAGGQYPNLSSILLNGGNGGSGLHLGGKGGKATYMADRVIHGIGDPLAGNGQNGSKAATVEVVGGDGGDAFGAPVATRIAGSGAGGAFEVLGHHGWDGGVAMDGTIHRDGQHGGDVIAAGGKGGDVVAGVQTAFASAGGGGARTDDLGDAEDEFDVSAVDVMGGSGGRGLSGCGMEDDERGGNGGDSGSVTVGGGAGGNVLTDSELVTQSPLCGLGGNVGNAWRGRPGDGGNGDPPGNPGEHGNRTVSVGEAGSGGNDECDSGEDLGEEEELAEAMGGESVCGEDADGGVCPSAEEGGFNFTATLTYNHGFEGEFTRTERISQTYLGGNPPMYEYSGSIEDTGGEPNGSESFTVIRNFPTTCNFGSCGSGALGANAPKCDEGVLLFPGEFSTLPDGAFTNIRVSFSGFAGCIYGFSCPEQIICDGNNRIRSGADCP